MFQNHIPGILTLECSKTLDWLSVLRLPQRKDLHLYKTIMHSTGLPVWLAKSRSVWIREIKSSV